MTVRLGDQTVVALAVLTCQLLFGCIKDLKANADAPAAIHVSKRRGSY